MNYKNLIPFVWLFFGCEAQKSPSELKLIGGHALDPNTFTSSGRMNGIGHGACTVTRVGPRHFLTAGHCDHQTDVNLQSHKNQDSSTNERQFKRSSISDRSYPDGGDPNDVSLKMWTISDEGRWVPNQTRLDGAFDWALIVLQPGNDPTTFASDLEWLEKNFDTRKLGDPSSLTKGETVMMGGFGNSMFASDFLVASCEGTTCVQHYKTKSFDQADKEGIFDDKHIEDKRFAYFKVDKIGDALFTAETQLTILNDKVFTFEKTDVGPKTEARGMLAEGDSGSAILNGQLEIVGVASSYSTLDEAPYGFVNSFGKFPREQLLKIIDTPVLDYAPSSVKKGDFFYTLGYKLNEIAYETQADGLNIIDFPIDEKCESLGEEILRTFLDVAKLERGKDFQCYGEKKDDPPPPADGNGGTPTVPLNPGDSGGDSGGGDLGTSPPSPVYCLAYLQYFEQISGEVRPAPFGESSFQETYYYDPEKPNFDAKSAFIESITKSAEETVSREGKGPYDYVRGVSCAGNTGGWYMSDSIEMVSQVLTGTDYKVHNDPSTICQGGHLEYHIQFYSYKFREISCTSSQ